MKDIEVEQSGILGVALTAAGDVAYKWNLNTDNLTWVGNLSSIFGESASPDVTSGEHFIERINSEDLARRLHSLNQHLSNGHEYDCEYRLRRDDGAFVWVHDRGSAEFDDNGHPLRLSGILRVINHRKHQESVLEHRANYDDLTGHLNKVRLREAVQHAIAYNERYKVVGAYLAIGIDKLAMINEAYGHQIADSVIIGVGQRIERCLRVTDVIGRLGGDRFGVVLSNCDEQGARIAAEKILENFRRRPIETPEGPIHITVSIGGVNFPGVIHTAHDAMTSAESALQESKTRGRNCFMLYESSNEQRQQHRENIHVGERVLQALEQNRLVFAYQPVVNCQTHETCYYETLMRMISEDGNVVSAGEFVPIAEKLGLMRLLDRRALELAVDDLRNNRDIILALNISSLTVTDQSWLRALVGEIKRSPHIAKRLMIEITETAALEDFEVSARFVSAVRELGCQVALDDFGSGYTSFRHMKSLTVDVVKIDGTFIADLANNPDNQLFVRTLLGLAEGFGLKTVAECVETVEEADLLKKEGADYLQGWYFGKPTINPDWRIEAPTTLKKKA